MGSNPSQFQGVGGSEMIEGIVQSARIVHGWSGGQAVQRFKSYPIASWCITTRVFGLKSMFLFFDKLLFKNKVLLIVNYK